MIINTLIREFVLKCPIDFMSNLDKKFLFLSAPKYTSNAWRDRSKRNNRGAADARQTSCDTCWCYMYILAMVDPSKS